MGKLQDDFIHTYWADVAREGKFIIGYAAHTNSQHTTPATLQPTSLNFLVSPYHNADGSIAKDTGLYTLNYLMDVQNRPLTVGAPFTWNWVSPTQEKSFHGVMAVRREVFARYLMSAVAPFLSKIALTPYTYVHIKNPAHYKTKWSLSRTPNQRLDYVAEPGAQVASYSFKAHHHELVASFS